MKIGLHIPDLTWPGGPAALGPSLAAVAQAADELGFDRISLMDHVWQIHQIGPPEHEMLEPYTSLGFVAAHTNRIKLLALVTAVVYREPGLVAKMVSTLDVLSGGRAMLGIGAAWNDEEALGLGLPFPPRAERFERLEEALQICLQMWAGRDEPYDGAHYHLGRTLNSPQPLTRPHPPILIGGSGERKTLRLVAKYGDACNMFQSPELAHKLEVLAADCEREGRSYGEIEKTVGYNFDVGRSGEGVPEILAAMRRFAELGFSVVHGRVEGVYGIEPLEILGREVIPALAEL